MGTPKTSLEIGGRPMLRHILESLHWPGPTLLVTSPSLEHPPGWELFDREATDPVEGEGPLRGVLTALLNSQETYVVICTVDMPALRSEHLNWIVRCLQDRPELDGVMIRRHVEGKQRIEPFPFACRKTAKDAVAAQIESAVRPVHSLLATSRFVAEDAPPSWSPLVWTNLNSPEDYQAFVQAV